MDYDSPCREEVFPFSETTLIAVTSHRNEKIVQAKSNYNSNAYYADPSDELGIFSAGKHVISKNNRNFDMHSWMQPA